MQAHTISRRRLFEMVGAAGALAFASPVRTAWTQSTKRIERLAPELDAIIDTSQAIRELATGFVDDLIGPNGLAFSPDENILYVNDARRRIVRAYDLLPNGTVAKQTSRLFSDMGGAEPGV